MLWVLATTVAPAAIPTTDPVSVRSGPLLRLRPLVILAAPTDRLQSGVGVGLSAGHRWWSIGGRNVRWSGSNSVQLEATAGGLRALRGTVVADVALWLGPLGIHAGPRLDAHRLRTRDLATGPFRLALGPQVGLGLATTPVAVIASVAPQWPLPGSNRSSTTYTLSVTGGGLVQPQLEGRLVTGLGPPQATVFLGARLDLGSALQENDD